MRMSRYILKRLLWMIPFFWVVVTITFILNQMMPATRPANSWARPPRKRSTRPCAKSWA